MCSLAVEGGGVNIVGGIHGCHVGFRQGLFACSGQLHTILIGLREPGKIRLEIGPQSRPLHAVAPGRHGRLQRRALQHYGLVITTASLASWPVWIAKQVLSDYWGEDQSDLIRSRRLGVTPGASISEGLTERSHGERSEDWHTSVGVPMRMPSVPMLAPLLGLLLSLLGFSRASTKIDVTRLSAGRGSHSQPRRHFITSALALRPCFITENKRRRWRPRIILTDSVIAEPVSLPASFSSLYSGIPIVLIDLSSRSFEWELSTNGILIGIPGVAPTSWQCSKICAAGKGHASAIPNLGQQATTSDLILKILSSSG